MAWPQRMSAEEILGMKPEELRSKLDSSVKKEDLDALKTQNETLSSTLADIQSKLAALTKTPDPDPDPVILADVNDPTTQILTDPSGYISRQTAPIQQTALQSRADVLEIRARQKYAGAFQQFGDLLTSTASKMPIAARAQDGFWDMHIRQIVGDQFINGKIESGNYPSLMGTSSFAPHSADAPDQNRGFSPDQVAFFKERGIPLERAAKIQQLMNNGEHLTVEAFKGKAGNA